MPQARTQTFLSFTLGSMEYGIDARQVREWRPFDEVTRFAAGTHVVPGVAQSRGVIMPIVDMRAAFGATSDPGALPGCPQCDVIILTLSHCVMGLVVEHVNGMVALHPEEIRAVPCVDGTVPADYLLGLGEPRETAARRLILVDIDRLMAVGQDRTKLTV
jgi:purine-binding chemotaxis protein CheW